MKPIILKPAKLKTSVPRAEIRRAVEEAFAQLGLTTPKKTASKRAAKKSAKKK